MCVGEINVKLPYNKITEYGISIDNLPDDITLKHPSSYGKAILRKILAINVYVTYHNNSQIAFNFHGLLIFMFNAVTNRPMCTATMTTVVGQQPTGQRPTTTAVGQQPTTTAVGQQRRPPTTAVGQQPTGQQPTTTAVGQQPTGQQPTTAAVGQQPPMTTVGQQHGLG